MHAGTVFDQCGTCRMGHERSLVAPHLHGVDNLRVIDASVCLPLPLPTQTQPR
nr:GMC oxidoreductase [Mesorhizobium alhagi]